MEPLDILRRYWGYDSFRGIQLDIIGSILAGRDTLGLMPTGGGKSVTFQIPALAMDGVCLVITPLISLMRDQVDRLRHLGIPAACIYSGMLRNEVMAAIDNCAFGDTKLLYVSPERLTSDDFRKKLQRINVSFITVDEAHCISQWGYDFRPSYLKIHELRQDLPDKAILALTATATPEVVKDIQRQLHFGKENVFRMSFRRKNLSYVVRPAMDRVAEIIHILRSVDGSAIVYTCSRRRTRFIAAELQTAGIEATFYHAGLDIAVKTKRQHDWQTGTVRVIVATNAFGMGIDKPDVRLVIHADVPTSLEAYFQEAGRAGRDGQPAYAVLLTTGSTQRVLANRVAQTFPDTVQIQDVYERLAWHYEIGVGMGKDFSDLFYLDKFCDINNLSPFIVDAALRILSNAGYIDYDTDDDGHTRVKFIVDRDALYNIDIPRDGERLIDAMLRSYTGMFTDYAFIDEGAMACKLGCETPHIFVLLADLRRRGVLKYVPPRNTPRITFRIDRVDGNDVRLAPTVYSDRRKVMEQHVKAMLEYIADTRVCRQTQLASYFGETNLTPCGHCDVCLDHRRNDSGDDIEQCVKAITASLADGEKHRAAELMALPFQSITLRRALDTLLRDGSIKTDSIYVKKSEERKSLGADNSDNGNNAQS